jgi:hypothetical protein
MAEDDIDVIEVQSFEGSLGALDDVFAAESTSVRNVLAFPPIKFSTKDELMSGDVEQVESLSDLLLSFSIT